MDEQEQLAKSRKFYGKLLVIGLFAFALLHSINPFFFRFFFWISFGLGAITLYYHIALKRLEKEAQPQFRSQGQRGGWAPPQQDVSAKAKVGKVIGIVIAIVFFIFFLLILIGIFAGEETPENNNIQDPVVQEDTLSVQ